VILETAEGRTLAGVGLHENGQLLVMSDATGKEVSVPKDQVKTQTTSRISLMPPSFEQALPPADLNDLLAFLLGQSEVGK
jgi:putative heme-binding domain-containing protein